MENYILTFNTILFCCLVVSFLIYKKAYIKGKLTCNNFILNSYLYILLSLLLICNTVILADKTKMNLFRKSWFFWFLLFSSIGLLILTMNLDPRKTIVKHMAWLLWILTMGITMYPIYLRSKQNGVFLSSLAVTFSMVALLTGFAFFRPDLINLKMGPVLTVLLLGGILLKMFTFIFAKKETTNHVGYLMSYAFIALFSLFILYDTKKLQLHAKNCVVPDYINESMGVFLDILNLFSNVSRSRSK